MITMTDGLYRDGDELGRDAGKFLGLPGIKPLL
jgi:hypothetical protein